MGSPPSAAVEVVAKPRVLKLHKPGHVRSAGPPLSAAPAMTDDADAAAAPTPAAAIAEPEPPAVGSKERITRRRQREISEAGGQPAVLARIPRDVSPSQLLLQGSAAAPVVAVTKTCRRPRQTLRATKELVARLSRPNCSALARQRSSHPTACPCRRSCGPQGGTASARTSSCTSSAFQSARSSTAAGRPTAARPSSRAPQCPGKKSRFGTAGRTSMQRLSQRLSVRVEPAASPGGAVTSSRPSPRAVTFAGPELELLTLDLAPRCDDDHTAAPRASRRPLADSQHGLPRDAVVVSESLIAALLARAADHGPFLREAAALRAENAALRELLEDTAHDLAEAQERAADLHDDYHNVVMVLEQASQEQAARDAAFLAHATSPVSSAPASSFSPHDVSQATTAIAPSCPSAGDANTVADKPKQRSLSLSRPRAKRSRSADDAATQDTQPPVVSRSSSAASTDGGTPDILSHPGPGPDPAASVGLAPRGSALLHPRLPSCGPSSPTAQRRPPPEFAAPKEAVVAKKEGPAPTEQPRAPSMTPRRRDPSLQSIRDSLGGVTSSASLLKGHPSPPPRGPDKENTATLPATPCADRGRGRLSVQERRQRSPSVRALLTRQSQQAV